MTSVRLAFTCSGALNNATPSEIASNPVSDDPPLAKARNKIKIAAAVKSPCSCPNDYNSAFGPCTAAEEGLTAINFCGYKCICPGEPDGDGTSSGQIYTSDCTDDYGSSSAFTLTSLYTNNFETYPEAKEFSSKLQDLSFYSEVADIKNKLSFKPIEFQQKTLFIKDLNLRLTNEEKTANVKEIPFVDHEIKFNDKETKIYKIREKKHDVKPDLSDIFGDDNGNKK